MGIGTEAGDSYGGNVHNLPGFLFEFTMISNSPLTSFPPAGDNSSLSLADAAFQLTQHAKEVTRLTHYRSPTTHHIVDDPAQVIDSTLVSAVLKTPGSSSGASNPSPLDNEDAGKYQVLRDFTENDLRKIKEGHASQDLEKIVQSYKSAILSNAHQIANLTTALEAERSKAQNLTAQVTQKQEVEREISRKSTERKVLEAEVLEEQRETDALLREKEQIQGRKTTLEIRKTELEREVSSLEDTLRHLEQTQNSAEDRIQELQYLNEHYEDSQQGTIEKTAQLRVNIKTEAGLCEELRKELEMKDEKYEDLCAVQSELEERINALEQSYDQELETSMLEEEESIVKLKKELEEIEQEIAIVKENAMRKSEEMLKIRADADEAKQVIDSWKVSHPCSTPVSHFPIIPSILAFSLGLFFSLLPVLFSLRLEVN